MFSPTPKAWLEAAELEICRRGHGLAMCLHCHRIDWKIESLESLGMVEKQALDLNRPPRAIARVCQHCGFFTLHSVKVLGLDKL